MPLIDLLSVVPYEFGGNLLTMSSNLMIRWRSTNTNFHSLSFCRCKKMTHIIPVPGIYFKSFSSNLKWLWSGHVIGSMNLSNFPLAPLTLVFPLPLMLNKRLQYETLVSWRITIGRSFDLLRIRGKISGALSHLRFIRKEIKVYCDMLKWLVVMLHSFGSPYLSFQ